MDRDLELPVDSPILETLFDFKNSILPEDLSTSPLTDTVLSELKLKDSLERMESLSRKVVLKRVSPSTPMSEETVYVFEVDVVCEDKKLKVNEREKYNKFRFFNGCQKATGVILIYSNSIHVIEAKLRVYREYKDNASWSENVILHHALEEPDEICKGIAVQKLKSLSKKIDSVKGIFHKYSMKTILNSAARVTFTKENIRELCCGVDLRCGMHYVGKAGAGVYVCRSSSTVNEIKVSLTKETLKEVAVAFGNRISYELSKEIESNLKTMLSNEFESLSRHISDAVYIVFNDTILGIILDLFRRLFESVGNILYSLFVFVFSLNVNSSEWRESVADEICEMLLTRREEIVENILPALEKFNQCEISNVEKISANINKCIKQMAVPSQKQLVKMWSRRELIEDRDTLFEKYPSIITYIAGEKSGEDIVKVFLRNVDEEAEAYFKKHVQNIHSFQFVHVAKKLGEKRKTMEESTKFEKHSFEKTTRKKLSELINKHGEKLMANYSNIVGIGVSRVMSRGRLFGEPCVVLYCLDESLVPFGENQIPRFLEGYPLDIREDIFMFGYCHGCPPLNNYCTIAMRNNDSAGSLGFFVKTKSASSPRHGFLTAAHVALEKQQIQNLYAKRPIFGFGHEIFHPHWEPDQNNSIGRVVGGLFGNYDPGQIGIDAAFVQLYNPDIRENIEQAIVGEDLDLPKFVTKTGTRTGTTKGIVVDDNFVCNVSGIIQGQFFCFFNCYRILNYTEGNPFFCAGDSGSAVYLSDRNDQPTEALGIAFASGDGDNQTVVCSIKKIVEAFDVIVYRYHEPMDV